MTSSTALPHLSQFLKRIGSGEKRYRNLNGVGMQSEMRQSSFYGGVAIVRSQKFVMHDFDLVTAVPILRRGVYTNTSTGTHPLADAVLKEETLPSDAYCGIMDNYRALDCRSDEAATGPIEKGLAFKAESWIYIS
jgi:hypothetical protein